MTAAWPSKRVDLTFSGRRDRQPSMLVVTTMIRFAVFHVSEERGEKHGGWA